MRSKITRRSKAGKDLTSWMTYLFGLNKSKLGTLTVHNLVKQHLHQQGRCALTGIPMIHEHGSYAIALDKKDPEAPFTFGNLRLICDWVKKAKGNLKDLQFKDLLDVLDDHRDSRLRATISSAPMERPPDEYVLGDVEGVFLRSVYDWVRERFWMSVAKVKLTRHCVQLRFSQVSVTPVESLAAVVVTSIEDDTPDWWCTRLLEIENGDVQIRGRRSSKATKTEVLFSCPLAAPDALERTYKEISDMFDSSTVPVKPVVPVFRYEVGAGSG